MKVAAKLALLGVLGSTLVPALSSLTVQAAEPAAAVAELGIAQMLATVEAIDRDPPSVTLSGGDGKSVRVMLRDPAKLDVAAVGDQVQVTCSQALAISVDRVPGR